LIYKEDRGKEVMCVNVRKSVGFKYVLEKDWWRLVDSVIDVDVSNVVGSAVFQYPLAIRLPASPQHLIGPLLCVLAKHKLDGGITHEELGDDSYRVTIVVDARREKSKH
jgi:hypothetical protein